MRHILSSIIYERIPESEYGENISRPDTCVYLE